MLPASFSPLAEMPLTAGGKIDRIALARLEPTRPEVGHVFQDPVTPTEVRLADLWREVLGVERSSATDNFFELGGDSLRATRLIARIREEFRIEIPYVAFSQSPTIARLAGAIDAGVVTPPRYESSIPLFGISTYTWAYAHLAPRFSDDHPFVPLFHRVRDEQRIRTIEELAVLFCGSIRAVQPHGPYLLCGHCYGGMVAAECARRLIAEGDQVALLVFLDTPVPGYPRFFPSLREVSRRIFTGSCAPAECLTCLDALARVLAKRLLTQMQKLLMRAPHGRRLLATGRSLRWHVRSARLYRPAQITVPVVQIIAADRNATRRALEDSCLAWRHFCSGRFEVRYLPCKHEKILEDPIAPTLAQTLRQLIAAAIRDNAVR